MAGLVVLLFLLVAAAMIGAAYLQYRARLARMNTIAAIGRTVGFTFSAKDTDHIVAMPFSLFSKGDGRGVECILSGTHDGLPMRLFDYWYYDETSDNRGNRSRQYHRFTCVLATIPAACPRFQLGYENFLTRLGDHLGLNDVELEYDDFNKRFRVKCKEQKFAFTLLDGDMMQWLLDRDGFESLEVVGPWVMLALNRLDPARWPDLGTWLDQFHAHIPPVVFSTYPAS